MSQQEIRQERGVGARDMVSAWAFFAGLFAVLMLLSGLVA